MVTGNTLEKLRHRRDQSHIHCTYYIHSFTMQQMQNFSAPNCAMTKKCSLTQVAAHACGQNLHFQKPTHPNVSKRNKTNTSTPYVSHLMHHLISTSPAPHLPFQSYSLPSTSKYLLKVINVLLLLLYNFPPPFVIPITIYTPTTMHTSHLPTLATTAL